MKGGADTEQSSAVEKSVGIPISCPAVEMGHNGILGNCSRCEMEYCSQARMAQLRAMQGQGDIASHFPSLLAWDANALLR